MRVSRHHELAMLVSYHPPAFLRSPQATRAKIDASRAFCGPATRTESGDSRERARPQPCTRAPLSSATTWRHPPALENRNPAGSFFHLIKKAPPSRSLTGPSFTTPLCYFLHGHHITELVLFNDVPSIVADVRFLSVAA